MNLTLVAGARPNFMKVAPVVRALEARGHQDWTLVHTGQHYDSKMSDMFFDELQMPKSHYWLGVGSDRQAVQTAKIMTAFEDVCVQRRPDRVVVVGDVNSTMGATLVAAKRVGNVMVDSLVAHAEAANQSQVLDQLGLRNGHGVLPYALATLHRPSNVDVPRTFEEIMRALERVGRSLPVILPAHPRSAARARFLAGQGIRVIEPLGYFDFLSLMTHAKVVLTDSGGVQEETTVLGVPCITLRDSTERPITVTMGTNRVVGTRFDRIVEAAESVLANPPSGQIPPLWDGRAAERIVEILLRPAA